MSPDDEKEPGGDPACWLSLVCDECGAMIEADGRHRPGCTAGDRSQTSSSKRSMPSSANEQGNDGG